MDAIGLESPRSRLVKTFEDALAALDHVGLPAIIRPSFTLGGGGGIAYNTKEFEDIVRGGLRLSPVSEVLIEDLSLAGKNMKWKSRVTAMTTASLSVRLKILTRWAFTQATP